MKICNIKTENGVHLCVETEKGLADLTKYGFQYNSYELIAGKGRSELELLIGRSDLPLVSDPVYAPILRRPGKVVCVGFNYPKHAKGAGYEVPTHPWLFPKFADAIVAADEAVTLPPYESSYDYEAELVVIMGKTAWNVRKEDALSYIFGYTCGNDLSCRDAQMLTTQFMIGKCFPGFGPCGPVIVTADSYDPSRKHIQSFVNGELRQDGYTDEMFFKVDELIEFITRYMRLEPGDLIFTGTPSGVELEHKEGEKNYLKPGDRVDVVIEGLGTLTNTMC